MRKDFILHFGLYGLVVLLLITICTRTKKKCQRHYRPFENCLWFYFLVVHFILLLFIKQIPGYRKTEHWSAHVQHHRCGESCQQFSLARRPTHLNSGRSRLIGDSAKHRGQQRPPKQLADISSTHDSKVSPATFIPVIACRESHPTPTHGGDV